MPRRRVAEGMVRRRWQSLLEGLWFVPVAVAAGFAALALLLVYGGPHLGLADARWTFDGDAPAARSLLSTIAGSLITVAGLTFSITILVLQLTASQLTPRALRNVFADRLTQVTIGTFVGTFVYCLLVLQAVRDEGPDGAGVVPAIGVTVSIVLAVLAVTLLIVFIHHVSQLVQVSHVASRIARQTLDAIERLYPEGFGGVDAALPAVAADPPEPAGIVHTSTPGFLSAVELERLAARLDGSATQVLICVCPGDFVGVDTPLALVWPAACADDDTARIRDAFTVTNERTLLDDAMFGVRQLADIAIRALSPSLNDPTTAVTCVSYLQSILVRLVARDFPSPVRRLDGIVVVTRVRDFDEYVAALAEVGRHALGDPRVTERVRESLVAIARAAAAAGAHGRGLEAFAVARMFAGPAAREASAGDLEPVLREAERRSSPVGLR
jgi:uncharacterized membrane protein